MACVPPRYLPFKTRPSFSSKVSATAVITKNKPSTNTVKNRFTLFIVPSHDRKSQLPLISEPVPCANITQSYSHLHWMVGAWRMVAPSGHNMQLDRRSHPANAIQSGMDNEMGPDRKGPGPYAREARLRGSTKQPSALWPRPGGAPDRLLLPVAGAFGRSRCRFYWSWDLRKAHLTQSR